MQIAYLLYDRFTALDITGPHDVLNSVPGNESIFVAEQAGPVRNESDTLSLVADATLDEVPSPDVVVVPGGFGNRTLLEHEPLHEWIRGVHETSTWTTSVCTGSLLLAAAGLLDGAPATTHWLARDVLAELGAQASRRESTWLSSSSPRSTGRRWRRPSSSASSTTRSRRTTPARRRRRRRRSSIWSGPPSRHGRPRWPGAPSLCGLTPSGRPRPCR